MVAPPVPVFDVHKFTNEGNHHGRGRSYGISGRLPGIPKRPKTSKCPEKRPAQPTSVAQSKNSATKLSVSEPPRERHDGRQHDGSDHGQQNAQ